jgi:hypothetical protein
LRLAAFAPDGQDVLIGSEAGKSRFWDLAAARPVGTPLEADAWILAARFDPVTGEAITASEGVTVQRWSVPRRLEGDPETIGFQVQAMTGLRLQEGGGIQILNRSMWLDAAARARALDPATAVPPEGTAAGGPTGESFDSAGP